MTQSDNRLGAGTSSGAAAGGLKTGKAGRPIERPQQPAVGLP